MFIGTATGPTLGSIIVRLTHSTIAVFFYALAVHVIFIAYVTLVVPESLPQKMRATNRKIARERSEELDEADGVIPRIKRLFSFLRPLSELAPRRVPVEGVQVGTKTRIDLSLTFIALCYAFSALVIVSDSSHFVDALNSCLA